MTGLDKIVKDIMDEADSSASSVLEQAQQDAQRIAAEAKQTAAERCASIRQKAEKEAAAVQERAVSTAALQKRKAVLKEKQQVLSDMIEQARQQLLSLPDEEYFALLLRMVKKYAPAKEGEILFSSADKKRLPPDFEASVNAELKEKGGRLKISQQTRKIDGGFVLAYGPVEENCSFAALFDARYDILQDKVNELVFAGG